MPSPALLILLLFLFAPPLPAPEDTAARPVLTPEERAYIMENRDKLTLFYNTDFPPIEFADSSGAFSGLGADLFGRLEDLLDVTFPRQAMPDWNQHLQALRNGTCAIAPTIVPTEERKEYLYFTAPYATVPVVIITGRQIRGRLALRDLEGMHVAVVSGFATETYMRKQARRHGFELVLVSDVGTGLETLAFGQVDAFVENLAVAAHYIDVKGIPSLRVAGITDYAFSWSIAVSRHYPLLFQAIEKALKALPPGELDALRQKWITLDTELGMDPQTLMALKLAGLFALLLVAGLALMSALLKRRLRQKIADLKASENRYRRLAENAPALIVQLTSDRTGTLSVSHLSDQAHTLTGLDPAKIGANPGLFMELVHPQDRESCLNDLRHSARTLRPVQVRFRFLQNNRYLWLEAHINPTPLPGACILWEGLILDVNDRVLAEERLRESEQRLQILIRNTSDSISILDADGTQRYVSPAAERLTGYSVEELKGTSLAQVVHPEDLGRVLSAWEEALNHPERTVRVQYRHIHKTRGHTFMEAVGQNFLAEPGIEGVVVSVRDITEWKQEQETRDLLQQQLALAQKMESVGRLAGGVAHDFNNMLGVILGHTEIALRQLRGASPLTEDLRGIQHAAERSAILTRQLLAFARKQAFTPQALELNAVVARSLHMLRTLIGEDVALNFDAGKNLGMVHADPAQIDHILVNLCVNARDALRETRQITIATRSLQRQTGTAKTPPQGQVLLSVRDTGEGMDRETLEHIFEPFFTTKGLGKGTGLGLASVYGIVQQNRGEIRVISTPGQGTTFVIFLPRLAPQETHPPPPSVELQATFSRTAERERILLVEDEPMLLKVTQNQLEQLGYSVIPFSSPATALELPPREMDQVALLLTDLVMPGMSGEELAHRLRKRYPGLPCLFMSGYTAAPGGVAALEPERAVLQKPFLAAELARRIDLLLHPDASPPKA